MQGFAVPRTPLSSQQACKRAATGTATRLRSYVGDLSPVERQRRQGWPTLCAGTVPVKLPCMSAWSPWLTRNEAARRRVARRATAWLAIGAILLNSLAPALAHQLAVRDASGWTEVCTARGIERVALAAASVASSMPSAIPASVSSSTTSDAPAAPASIPHTPAFEHCPFCVSNGASFASPLSASFAVAFLRGTGQLATRPDFAPRGIDDWRPAHPRAPPLAA